MRFTLQTDVLIFSIMASRSNIISELMIITIVHFKRLGSRHIHQEIEIPYCVFRFNEIICKTGLKHIQTLTHKCNIIKEEHFEALWSHTMYLCGIYNFAKCVHQKGVTSFYAMIPILTYTQIYWIHRIGNCRSIQCW